MNSYFNCLKCTNKTIHYLWTLKHLCSVLCKIFSLLKKNDINHKLILYMYLNMEKIYTRLKYDLIKQGFKIDDMFLQNL